jgi:hypothetical protein
MQRIIWTHQSSQPFYVFDEEHIVHFWNDGVAIHRANQCYRDANTLLSPFDAPHIYLLALPLAFYKTAVLSDRLPISLSIEGNNLGTVTVAAQDGLARRTIIRQDTRLALADGFLSVVIEAMTDDIDAERQRFDFPFPLDLVPELLDLSESERRVFERDLP